MSIAYNRSFSSISTSSASAGYNNGSTYTNGNLDSPATTMLKNESPLKLFVLAKRNINEIFSNIHVYLQESKKFLLQQSNEILTQQDQQRLQHFDDKIDGIRDVLSRDHMKVAFFGRTSNGKSTVINAVLSKKILPSGMGHTTNCFLQVEGSDTNEGYLIIEEKPNERLNIESVLQLANALNSQTIGESTLVKICWPKNKCQLLLDDVVLVDSPGIDVSPNLDEWIDKYCLDADVFVLVSNAESTLMQTEKAFFHKVNERLSKPNIFILNNRWDAAASEPENIELVRKQHLDREVAFLCDELNIITRNEAEDRVYFVSAKEVLQTRLNKERDEPLNVASFADGYLQRYIDFEKFERKFEECLSKTATKTKFNQHTERGKTIIQQLCSILDSVNAKAIELKNEKLKLRNKKYELLEYTQQQMQLLTNEVKHQICHLVEQVELKVCSALNEEIRRLSLLVNDFEKPFSSNPLVVSLYKKELHSHVETGLGSNLRARLSTALHCCIESSQKEMIGRITALVPETEQHRQYLFSISPRQTFEILYRINCESLCADFQEDLEFHFTFSLFSFIRRLRYWTSSRQRHGQFFPGSSLSKSLPSTAPQTPSNEKQVVPANSSTSEMISIISKVITVVPQTETVIGALVLGGFMVKTTGWYVIVGTCSIYGVLYAYERLTWTDKAKERSFKKQYVNHATRKLKLIVDLTSANCSHQVQQELTSTFARLCHLVDEVVSGLQMEIKELDREIEKLTDCANNAKILRNKATFISTDLDKFVEKFLSYDS